MKICVVKCIALLSLLVQPYSLFAEGSLDPLIAEVEVVMEACATEPKLKLHASTISEAAIKQWPENEKARTYWYILLCMESGFNPDAGPSSAGAVGIGQIMPEYAKEFAEQCGLNPPSLEELRKLKINLAISSCRYAHLFDMFQEDAALALASYNAGPNSGDIKRLQKNGARSINRETMGYLALAFSLYEKIERLKHDKKLHSHTHIGNYLSPI